MSLTDQEIQGLEVADKVAAAWHALDRDAILALFSEDASMQSMMKAPYKNKAEIGEMLDGFLSRATAVRMEVLTKIARDDVVVMERRDHFTVDGKDGILPAIGVFHIRDGLITSWREYYDWNYYLQQMEK